MYASCVSSDHGQLSYGMMSISSFVVSLPRDRLLRLTAVTPPQPDETDLGEMIHLVCLRPIEGSTCTET